MATTLSVVSVLLAVWLATAWWHANKPLPRGLGITGPWREVGDLHLLLDESYRDSQGEWHCRQAIFDEIFRLIGQARRLLVLDIFQFNVPGENRDCYRPLAQQLRDALLRRKAEVPDLEIVLITDPINSVYGGRPTPHFDALRQAGIQVVVTDLAASRDPNPTWSALWRLAFRWLGNTSRGGWLPNPLGPGKVTLRSYLATLNFNANHRKTLVVDHGNDWVALVSSSNADDASSDYLDTAIRFASPAALDLLDSELAVAEWSGLPPLGLHPAPLPPADAPPHQTRLRVLTEGAIRAALLDIIRDTHSDERLDIAVLFLSHRSVIEALKDAHRRGVAIRLLLDPNKSHFGHASPGIPNRQAAHELHRAGIAIRWYDTRGEQAHSKVLLRSGGTRPAELLLGSANFTRRSLDDLNLEADIQFHATKDHPVIRDVQTAFERHWHNLDDERFSLPFDAHSDPSRWRYWRYRWLEVTGWSTF
ncbi:phospholipase D [Litchfieldella qijiaojingensis]|uniref:phospholipase D n=1 Tax=Litchfieldella qijiaojingensis TaxID=980347 RepID=A0ABQ2YTM9_9GAMM|nr:phospholipase D-like domain-containing protein [Halomonas qijiaojingensis]GGX94997.1 phospholipase D [Halomonas qijiaojingensis]